jgi:hypothetical protein
VGLVIVLGLAVLVIHRALTRGFGRRPVSTEKRHGAWDLVIVVLAVVIAGAYIVSSISRGLLDSGPSGPWLTSEGVNLKAGFIAGCSKGAPSRTGACECLFARLSSIPPYNTPSGFEALSADLQTFAQTHDTTKLPPAVFSSIHTCTG